MSFASFYYKWETRICSIVVLSVGLPIILFTYSDYGISWDDYSQAIYGKLVSQNWSSIFHDRSANKVSNLRHYGPLFELLASGAFTTSKYPIFEVRHLLTAITGLLSIIGTISIASKFGIKLVPTFTMLALTMMPRFYGHSFINSKDIPLACAITWSQLALYNLCSVGRFKWINITYFSLGCGIASLIRPNILPFVILHTILNICLISLRELTCINKLKSLNYRKLCKKLLFPPIFIWILMIFFWPWAQENPLVNPIKSIFNMDIVPYTYRVLFEGKSYESDSLPWYYSLKWVSITVPIPVVLSAVSILVIGMIRAIKKHQSKYLILQIVTWVFIPLIVISIGDFNIYDGMRHFMFILPGIALSSAYSTAALIDLVSGKFYKILLISIFLLLYLRPFTVLLNLHPYQYIYFNEFVGGLKGAGGNYETDYWVTSYKEGAEWINERAKSYQKRPVYVLVAATDLSFPCADYYFDKSMIYSVKTNLIGVRGNLPEQYDYYLATTRYGFSDNFDEAEIVKEIKKEGVVLSVIKRRK